MLALLGTVIYTLASLYLLVMFVRMIIDWIGFLAPSFQPKGLILVIANLAYALTDPPIRALRTRIPPLRVGGGVALDIGFMIVFIGVLVIMRIGNIIHALG